MKEPLSIKNRDIMNLRLLLQDSMQPGEQSSISELEIDA